MKRNKNKKGFTIVELVIVIGVIGILSAILIPTFVSLTSKAQDAALKSNLANAYSMYAADAADGHLGEDGAALEFYGQDEVILSEAKTGTSVNGYNYSNSDGWAIATASYNVGTEANKYTLVVEQEYLGYYVYYFHAQAI